MYIKKQLRKYVFFLFYLLVSLIINIDIITPQHISANELEPINNIDIGNGPAVPDAVDLYYFESIIGVTTAVYNSETRELIVEGTWPTSCGGRVHITYLPTRDNHTMDIVIFKNLNKNKTCNAVTKDDILSMTVPKFHDSRIKQLRIGKIIIEVKNGSN